MTKIQFCYLPVALAFQIYTYKSKLQKTQKKNEKYGWKQWLKKKRVRFLLLRRVENYVMIYFDSFGVIRGHYGYLWFIMGHNGLLWLVPMMAMMMTMTRFFIIFAKTRNNNKKNHPREIYF